MDSNLLLKYLRDSANPKEVAKVQTWLSEDPEGKHRAMYRRIHDIYNITAVSGGRLHGSAVRQHFRIRRILLSAVAGVAAALAVVALVRWQRVSVLDGLATQTETVSVPAGKSLMLKLEDGTQMWLNSTAEIERPVVFGRGCRRIKVLSGEVLFDVAKDAERPFVVETFATTVTVLGTRFNVEVDEDAQKCEVSLLRGKVSTSVGSGTVELAPNERLSFEGGKVVRSGITNISAVDCWTEGLIDVSDEPFDHLMRKFEKAYNVNILIERDALPEVSYTRGKIRISDGIEHALDVLRMASDFSYTRDFNTNTIIIK